MKGDNILNLHGKAYTNEDLLRHNNPSALFGAKRFELAEGRARGQRFIEVKTAAGLRFTLAEDKCLDIAELEYRGVNLAFLSKNGFMPSSLANAETGSFIKYWSGGFLATCGLRNTGGGCVHNGETFATHGHISQTPAEDISIRADFDAITVTGKVRETALFGACLEMERTITVPTNGARIKIEDTISNLTAEDEIIFILYHINFGFPFLSEGLELTFPEGGAVGRTDEAQRRINDRLTITKPIDGEPEFVYFYSPKERNAKVILANKQAGIRATVSYDSERLPVLAQWKCMKSGDYALGIEPGTSRIRGRKEEIEDGYDIKVPAFGKLSFGFEVDITDI
jgi:hypothetical protein